jgi:membrane-bound ClpP family serine protease
MKTWVIAIMIIMSLGVSAIVMRLSEKKWGKRGRVVVFFFVLGIIWLFFWMGTL